MTGAVAIALDAMGSDLGPAATCAGAAEVSRHAEGPRIFVVGDADVLRKELEKHPHDPRKIRVVHAGEVIAQDDKPKDAVERKAGASILVAAELVKAGECDVLVSAGNTGAVTLSCARMFARLPGVHRAALGAVYPTERRRGEKEDPFSLILDAGLGLEAGADDLVGFAVMGAAYSKCISKNPRPRVGLLSVGGEEGKGTDAVVKAHATLKRLAAGEAGGGLDFIGNIEGMDIPRGTADVVVTSGFTGNIVLKMLEGISETVMRLARSAGEKSLQYKAGLALLAPAIRRLRQVTDWQEYGGVPILGFDRLCIKAHGRSTGRAIRNALRVAHRAARTDTVGAIQRGLEAARAL
ncbi:MAG: phosphate acyltransferase PlsX [Deltaproteobacteria bacterium]|jgi:glycerol-3-phosphate acyltransferase PlsX